MNGIIDELRFISKCHSVRPDSARVVQGNLTANTKGTAERIINECLECWGRLDVLINNASQFHTTEIGKVSEDIWNKFIQTNMSAPFFLSQVGGHDRAGFLHRLHHKR